MMDQISGKPACPHYVKWQEAESECHRLREQLHHAQAQRDSHEAAKMEVAKRLIIAEKAVSDRELLLEQELASLQRSHSILCKGYENFRNRAEVSEEILKNKLINITLPHKN